MAPESGWRDLFLQAFRRSKNAMALLDERRRLVDVNGASLQLLGYKPSAILGRPVYEFVVGGPLASDREWRAVLRQERFTGVADLRCSDGRRVTLEFAGHPAVVTGQRLVLFVAVSTTRIGGRRPPLSEDPAETGSLTRRELEVIRLIALGASGPEIADELQLAHNTIRTHVRNSMTKLGARSRAQLVARTLGEGLVLLEPAEITQLRYWQSRRGP